MSKVFACAGVIALCSQAAFPQQPDSSPKFEIADVHASAKSVNRFMRTGPVRGGRYDVKSATMVDLIRIAYGFDTDKILGGPSWLESDRFDVSARVPADSTPDSLKPMMQALLADRFKLVVQKETRPLPGYALTVGKKAQLRESDGSGDTGCRPQTSSGAPGEGAVRMMTSLNGGPPTTFTLGPGMTIQFQCRNMTMAAFAEGLRGMMGSSLGTSQVLDETGLKGAWNFDVKWSMQIIGPMPTAGERITLSEALEKQLGLKLEPKQIPTPVLVVESANRTPGENPAGVSEALPPIAAPKEFEVADLKPTDPEFRMGNFQMQPGGRLVVKGMNLRFVLNRAFNTFNAEELVGVPKWADTDRYDITAKLPAGASAVTGMDMDLIAPPLRALLTERFKLAWHTEERPVNAYSLVSAKPKMKAADPASRTFCKNVPPAPGAAPRSRVLNCQNINMTQFAEQLQNIDPALSWPVVDATQLKGGWDFTLTFSFPMPFAVPRGPDAPPPGGDVPQAADPSGTVTIFEAVEKQLGLKLEKQKRSMSVTVIDHLEQKPTDN